MEQSGKKDALDLEITEITLDLTKIERDISQYTLLLEGKTLDEHELELSLRIKQEAALQQDILSLQEQI